MRLHRLALRTWAILVALFFATPAIAQLPLPQPATFPSGPNPATVSTFNSIGIYWHGGGGPGAQVEYKEATSQVWKRGHDLWYDSRNNEHRGSLVELKAGMTYDIRLNGGTPFQAATWSDSRRAEMLSGLTMGVLGARVVCHAPPARPSPPHRPARGESRPLAAEHSQSRLSPGPP